MQNHSVYLIDNGRHVKIGHGADPRKRLRCLTTGSDAPLTLAWAWRMSRPQAVKFEAHLHKFLAAHRIHGEWFRISAQCARLIGDALRRRDATSAKKVLICGWMLDEIAEDIEANRLALMGEPTPERRQEIERDTEGLKEAREDIEDELADWWSVLSPDDGLVAA